MRMQQQCQEWRRAMRERAASRRRKQRAFMESNGNGSNLHKGVAGRVRDAVAAGLEPQRHVAARLHVDHLGNNQDNKDRVGVRWRRMDVRRVVKLEPGSSRKCSRARFRFRMSHLDEIGSGSRPRDRSDGRGRHGLVGARRGLGHVKRRGRESHGGLAEAQQELDDRGAGRRRGLRGPGGHGGPFVVEGDRRRQR